MEMSLKGSENHAMQTFHLAGQETKAEHCQMRSPRDTSPSVQSFPFCVLPFAEL
jgi:hypothetical protein